MAVPDKIAVFMGVTPFNLVELYRDYGGHFWLHLQVRRVNWTGENVCVCVRVNEWVREWNLKPRHLFATTMNLNSGTLSLSE
jgi:hypothetical protein